MIYSLEAHERKYALSINDGLFSLATALSGAPYAQRHFQLSKTSNCPGKLGHRIIALIESVPLIGGVAALIERIVASLFAKTHTMEQSPEELQKMWTNTRKAFEEHNKKVPGPYALPETIPTTHPLRRLTITHWEANAQGPRQSMEDAHFFAQVQEGYITGVFDGHGGQEIAQLAARLFPEKFPETLKKMNGSVRKTFTTLFDEIHQEAVKHTEWNRMGCTAVTCFIESKTHRIYTATIGDSEANVYRTIDGKCRSLPLSCVRDWSCRREAARVAKAYKNMSIAHEWSKTKNPKTLRYGGLNLSRALGDHYLTLPASFKKDVPCDLTKPVVLHKPKISVQYLQPKDTLLLACDGLKDYVPENEIIQQVESTPQEKLAQRLVKTAIEEKKAFDNVTVLAIKVE